MSDMPHELTEEEVRDIFLDHVRHLIDYWAKLPGIGDYLRVEGVAFSIMVMLDGGAGELPGFIVAPSPHPDDKAFLEGEGENWYPENDGECIKSDIAGGLHEYLMQRKVDA